MTTHPDDFTALIAELDSCANSQVFIRPVCLLFRRAADALSRLAAARKN
jgi:hypothetical protein